MIDLVMYAYAIGLAVKLDDCNPEVGMGQTVETIASVVAEECRIRPTYAEMKAAIVIAKEHYQHPRYRL